MIPERFEIRIESIPVVGPVMRISWEDRDLIYRLGEVTPERVREGMAAVTEQMLFQLWQEGRYG